MCMHIRVHVFVYMDTCNHLGITFTIHNHAYILNIHLITEIYNKRDVLKIPRNDHSLTIAPGEYSFNVLVYPDRMTRVMNKSRILLCSDL